MRGILGLHLVTMSMDSSTEHYNLRFVYSEIEGSPGITIWR